VASAGVDGKRRLLAGFFIELMLMVRRISVICFFVRAGSKTSRFATRAAPQPFDYVSFDHGAAISSQTCRYQQSV
jgi:hypothetical protein